MDQLKPILAGISKYRFWVGLLVMTLVSIVTFYLVYNSLNGEKVKAETAITNNFKQMKTVQGVGETDAGRALHPNNITHSKINDELNEGRVALRKAWEMQYKKQEAIYVWPAKSIGNFAAKQFSELFPFEKKVPFQPQPSEVELEINQQTRFVYGRLINTRLPELSEIIGEVWAPAKARLIQEGKKIRKRRTVLWNEDNQNFWESQFTMGNEPRTIEVLYAQEDLWILESILTDVIKKTNGDATANDLAVVKEIDHIFFGQSAQGISGALRASAASSSASSGGSSGGSAGMSFGFGAGQSDADAGQSSAAASSAPTNDPAHNRYVDRQFKPLGGGVLRSGVDGSDPEKAYLAVAKRVPVKLGLVMDERKILDLLVNCANARLPIEVKQVRVNRHTPNEMSVKSTGGKKSKSNSRFDGDDPIGAGGSGGMSAGGGGAMSPGGGGSSGLGGGRSKTKMGESSTLATGYDIPVEIYGIMYLYNPPDEKLLQLTDEDGQPLKDQQNGGTPSTPTANRTTNPTGKRQQS